jgi:hypothetical protein
LQKEWKSVKLNAKENPLGMSVYKLAGKDGKGSWFARRSVHEGLGFKKWKTALQREFPETLKVQGGPGEGNIRGIGGEERVEYQVEEGVGTMEGVCKLWLQRCHVLITSSVSIVRTISWADCPPRLCYNVLDVGSSAQATEWGAGASTFHGGLKTMHTSRYSAKRRIY